MICLSSGVLDIALIQWGHKKKKKKIVFFVFLLFVTHSTKVGFSSYTLISRKMVFSDFLIVSCFCLSTADVGTFALMNSLSLYFLFLNSSSDFFFSSSCCFERTFIPLLVQTAWIINRLNGCMRTMFTQNLTMLHCLFLSLTLLNTVFLFRL